MKKLISLLIFIGFFAACNNSSETENSADTNMENPLLQEFNGIFGIPPFSKIKAEHYLPAFKKAIEEQRAEIDAIIKNSEAPTFDNTIIALERSGSLLNKISWIFYNMVGANTSDELQAVSKEVAPLISQHGDDISLNADLFARVKTVYDKKAELQLDVEQSRLLDEHYKSFVRGGANLDEAGKKRLREINEQLSVLYIQFQENVLAETNAFQLVIDNEKDLAGLPQSAIDAASETATAAGQTGKWIFTLHKPSLIPFLQYAENRDLRKKIYDAYANRGNNGNANDNKAIIQKIVPLRIEKANVLGFETYAAYVLDDNMAKTPENVFELLNKIWDAAKPVVKNEATALQAMITKEGGNFKLEPHDWWYYAEKLRKEKYDLDENELRPYFQLENVRDGAFMVANKLWGIKFEQVQGVELPHPDAIAYEVKEADGTHIGILFMDFFPRESKNGGAWMDNYRAQYVDANGTDVRPIITNVLNFSKPTGNTPALLSIDEVTTLFHEFGHALHGLLSKCNYLTLSGTNVARDFVELPSQLMENWATHPEVMPLYAKHYQTGEPIPAALIEKLNNSQYFNQGFTATEYLAASLLDMKWHTLTQAPTEGVMEFEQKILNELGLIPEIYSRYRSPYFSHIFSSDGYSAGYYSYIWAEVLDADAFNAFEETNVFDPKTAEALRTNILSKGGTVEPMELYKRFRGQEPDIKPLLIRKGLVSQN